MNPDCCRLSPKKKGSAQLMACIANLQTRVTELKKMGKGHLEIERELASSKDLLQKTIDVVATPVMVIDRNYKIILANQAVKKITQDPNCVAKGLMCYQASHHNSSPCAGPATKCPMQQVVLTRAPVTVVHTHYNEAGKEIVVEVHAAPVFDVNNEVVQVIESCHEIIERRNLERVELEIRKNEKQLMGQELHDGIAQHLTATALAAKVLEKKVVQNPSKAQRGIKRVVAMLNQAILQTRELAYGLYGLEMQTKDIASSLKRLAHDTEKNLGVHCTVKINDVNVHVPHDGTTSHLYGIAREAVANAVKHGQAKHIRIQLKKKNTRELELRIENDGKKFLEPSKQEGLGLHLIRTRASKINASFEIKPRPRGGTTVSCIFPVLSESHPPA